eukprot:Nk52_evm17s228 gene=Nk52_evmTU17s228
MRFCILDESGGKVAEADSHTTGGQGRRIHTDTVTCVGWTSSNELYSCSDDHNIHKWSQTGEGLGNVCTLPSDTFATDMQWLPLGGSLKRGMSSELMVISATDGKFHLVSKTGRIEKTVEAHRGAILGVKWAADGSALVSVGEDGQVKVYSKSGMLRSTLAQVGSPVYAAAWGPDSENILYTSEKQLIIKPLHPSSKPIAWKAHDGVILAVDWNRVNGRIVSGGEDRKYKVWDSFGRSLFSSSLHAHSITSVAWANDGELFAVGSFNTLRLCDQIGWSYSMEKPDTGSILQLAWTGDGTEIAGAGANGNLCFARLVDRRLEWKNIDAVVTQENKIVIKDVLTGAKEVLDFRDPIIKVSLDFGYLVVATSSQCLMYSHTNWNTPAIFDLKNGTVNFIIQCEKHFLMVDTYAGAQVFNYEGRQISSPSYQGLQSEFLNVTTVSISNDTVAIKDRSDQKLIHVIDVNTGKELPNSPIRHTIDVLQIALDQPGTNSLDRHLAVVDKNNDLYVCRANATASSSSSSSTKAGFSVRFSKLGTMVESIAWSDCTDMLAAILDGKLTVWYYPGAADVDPEMLSMSRMDKDASDFGKSPQIVSFVDNLITVRRADGALLTTTVSPYPSILYRYTSSKKWDDALRLCRFVKDKILWACLAVCSMQGQELNTAEAAFAAINEAAKVQYIKYIKEIPTPEGRSAELALFRRQPLEAEHILLQAGLIYAAIKLNINQFNWDRALDLALKHKTHVDTVLAFRLSYLESFGRKENDPRFLEYAQEITVDWEKINAKIEMEKQKERERPGAVAYS